MKHCIAPCCDISEGLVMSRFKTAPFIHLWQCHQLLPYVYFYYTYNTHIAQYVSESPPKNSERSPPQILPQLILSSIHYYHCTRFFIQPRCASVCFCASHRQFALFLLLRYDQPYLTRAATAIRDTSLWPPQVISSSLIPIRFAANHRKYPHKHCLPENFKSTAQL